MVPAPLSASLCAGCPKGRVDAAASALLLAVWQARNGQAGSPSLAIPGWQRPRKGRRVATTSPFLAPCRKRGAKWSPRHGGQTTRPMLLLVVPRWPPHGMILAATAERALALPGRGLAALLERDLGPTGNRPWPHWKGALAPLGMGPAALLERGPGPAEKRLDSPLPSPQRQGKKESFPQFFPFLNMLSQRHDKLF